MKKPVLNSEVSIYEVIRRDSGGGIIQFYGTPDAVEDFSSFGHIDWYGVESFYGLNVDPRYDFDEVLEYIKKYNQSN